MFGDARGVVEAPNLSAGTLSLIGWLTLLMKGEPQPIVMLEEPELGLTPRSTKAIYEAMCAATTADEPTQLLVASHSPRILHWAAGDYGLDRVYVVTPGDGAAETTTYQVHFDQGGFGHDPQRAMGVEIANQVMHGF